jgi:hypothetical protein
MEARRRKASAWRLNFPDGLLSGSGLELLDDYSGASSPVALGSLISKVGSAGELELLCRQQLDHERRHH